jgi:hypothetical protein
VGRAVCYPAAAALTGGVWAAVYIYAASRVPTSLQYTLLLLIVMITAFSVGFSVVVREYFVAYVFAALWPIAWWSLVHYWQHPNNLVIGLVLLAFCALLVAVCERVHSSFHTMITLNWERDAMSRDLGDLTNSLRSRNSQLRAPRRGGGRSLWRRGIHSDTPQCRQEFSAAYRRAPHGIDR